MKKYLKIAIISSLTLGLAPFSPEPHIWKQLMNLWNGRSMPGMDWLDLFMHGAPWIFLIIVLASVVFKKRKLPTKR